MKNATKLLNLLTAFLSVIGICAASLVCFIVAYTQINGGFSSKRITDQSAVMDQANNNITINPISFNTDSNNNSVFKDLPDNDIKSNYNSTESLPLTVDSTLDEICEQPAFEYNTNSTTTETDYTSDSETGGISNPVIYSMPVEQGISTAPPIEQNVPSDIYPYEVPEESSNQIINDSIVTENTNNFNTNSTLESQGSAPVTDSVWLSEMGTKYHSIDHCGRMNPDKARQVSLDHAISEGYEKCDKCF